MAKIKNQLSVEIKQLPLMLGKLVGAFITVGSFVSFIIINPGDSGLSWSDILPYALTGLSGLVIFILCGRAIEKKKKENPESILATREKIIINVLSWAILISLSVSFLLFVIFATN